MADSRRRAPERRPLHALQIPRGGAHREPDSNFRTCPETHGVRRHLDPLLTSTADGFAATQCESSALHRQARGVRVKCASPLQRDKQESKRAEQELEGRLIGAPIAVRSVVSGEVRQMRGRLVTGPLGVPTTTAVSDHAPRRTIEMSPRQSPGGETPGTSKRLRPPGVSTYEAAHLPEAAWWRPQRRRTSRQYHGLAARRRSSCGLHERNGPRTARRRLVAFA